MEENVCAQDGAHNDIAEKVSKVNPDEEVLFEAAELLKVFGDSTRIRIIFVLCQQEMCVCDIARQLNMTQSAISHQLASLKKTKLVTSRKIGKLVYYSMADDHIKNIYRMALEHIRE